MHSADHNVRNNFTYGESRPMGVTIRTSLEILFLAGALIILAFLVYAFLIWRFLNTTCGILVVTTRLGIILGPRFDTDC
jgi:hypothetical protein